MISLHISFLVGSPTNCTHSQRVLKATISWWHEWVQGSDAIKGNFQIFRQYKVCRESRRELFWEVWIPKGRIRLFAEQSRTGESRRHWLRRSQFRGIFVHLESEKPIIVKKKVKRSRIEMQESWRNRFKKCNAEESGECKRDYRSPEEYVAYVILNLLFTWIVGGFWFYPKPVPKIVFFTPASFVASDCRRSNRNLRKALAIEESLTS